MTSKIIYPEEAGGTWWIGLSQEEHQAASNRIRAARLAASEEDLGDEYYDRSIPMQDELSDQAKLNIESFFKQAGLKAGEFLEEDSSLTYPKI